jgi:hypothetical protein
MKKVGYTNGTMSNEILSIKNFVVLDSGVQNMLMQEVLKSKEVHDNTPDAGGTNRNFRIQTQNPFFKTLYQEMLGECQNIFGELNLSKYNSDACWSVCSNKHYWESVPHDHTKTAIINSVYYLNVPKVDGKYVGAFRYVNKQGEWAEYQPEPFELLIMPAYLTHDNGFHDTEEWRISVNMEIITQNHVDFTLLNIK